MKEKTLLIEGVVFDTFAIFYLIKRLSQPFSEWDAYKLGIIDDKGKVLKTRSKLKTNEEKSAFSLVDLLLLNIKKILAGTSGGSAKLATFAAAMFFLKEEKNARVYENDEDSVYEAYMDFFENITQDPILKKEISEYAKRAYEQMKTEDAPANVVGDGSAVSVDQPVVNKKKLKRFDEY